MVGHARIHPDFKGNNQVLEIKNVEIIPQYQVEINK